MNVLSLTRHIRMFLSFAPKKRRYGPEQVYLHLRGLPAAPDDPEIGRMVERLPTILREPGVRRRYDGFQRYFDVLPRIIFLYHRGTPSAQIAADLSFMGTETGVETVLRITSRLVAERLNQIA